MRMHLLIFLLFIFFACLPVNKTQADVIQNGLIHWYKGDGNASDSVGSVHGTEVGSVAYVPGIVDQAFSFSGAGYVQLGGLPVPTSGNFTVGLWYKQTPGADQIREFFSQSGETFDHFYIGIDQRPSIPTNSYRAGDSWPTTGVPVAQSGVWHHVAVVKTATDGLFYLNGNLVGQLGSPLANPNSGAADHSYIGVQFNLSENLDGLIDNVTIYDRALSSDEVSQLATIPEPSCVAFLAAGFAGLFVSIRRRRPASG